MFTHMFLFAYTILTLHSAVGQLILQKTCNLEPYNQTLKKLIGNSITTMENSMVISQILKTEIPHDLSILILAIYAKELKSKS